MRILAGAIILSFICASIAAHAQTTATTATTNTPAAPVEQSVTTQQSAPANTVQTSVVPGMNTQNSQRLFGSLSVGYSSNLYEKTSYKAEADTSFEGILNVRVKGNHLLRTYMGASQDQNHGQETHLKDGFVAWVNDGFWYRGKITTVSQQVRLAVPASKESVKRDEKITGVTVAPVLMYNLTPAGLIGVILIYQPAVTKNFHKYETNRAFVNQSEYTVSQLFRALWSFTEKAYILSDFVYRNAWSYGGIKKNDSAEYSLALGYSFTQALSVSAGVSTNATIRNFENGSDQNIALFNKNTSSVFTGLTYVF